MSYKLKKNLSTMLMITTLIISMFPIFMKDVYASGFSVSPSQSTVAPGGQFSVTVTASGMAGGPFSVSCSNATCSVGSIAWLDNGSATITATAGSSGTATVSVSGLVSDFDNPGDKTVSGSASVSIVAPTPSGGGGASSGGTPQTNTNTNNNVETKSANNNLSALTVNDVTLLPEFNVNTVNYTADLPATAKKVTINATPEDAKATVDGIGEKDLVAGENTFVVTCTAEDGSQKGYTIVLYVNETPQVFATYGNRKLGVVRNIRNVEIPNGFEAVTVTLGGKEVSAYKNNLMNKTIVYMVDEKGVSNFYLFDAKKGITSIYIPIAISGHNVAVVDIEKKQQKRAGMIYKESIEIENQKLPGWTYKDSKLSDFTIHYLMNEKGEMVLYQYDKAEGVLQRYNNAASVSQDDYESLEENLDQRTLIMYGAIAAAAVLGLSLVGSCIYFSSQKRHLIRKARRLYEMTETDNVYAAASDTYQDLPNLQNEDIAATQESELSNESYEETYDQDYYDDSNKNNHENSEGEY